VVRVKPDVRFESAAQVRVLRGRATMRFERNSYCLCCTLVWYKCLDPKRNCRQVGDSQGVALYTAGCKAISLHRYQNDFSKTTCRPWANTTAHRRKPLPSISYCLPSGRRSSLIRRAKWPYLRQGSQNPLARRMRRACGAPPTTTTGNQIPGPPRHPKQPLYLRVT
jgi:hypothetical protein